MKLPKGSRVSVIVSFIIAAICVVLSIYPVKAVYVNEPVAETTSYKGTTASPRLSRVEEHAADDRQRRRRGSVENAHSDQDPHDKQQQRTERDEQASSYQRENSGGQQPEEPLPEGLNISQRIVTTKYGQLRGFIRQIDAGVAYASHFKEVKVIGSVETFLGIPYASPPVRLMPPKGPTPWSGVKIFAKHGPVCPQIFPLTPNAGSTSGGVPKSRPSRSYPASSAAESDYDDDDESEHGHHAHYQPSSNHQQPQNQGSSSGGKAEDSSAADAPFLSRMPKGRLKQLKRLMPLLQEESEDCLRLNVYVPLSDSPGRNAGHASGNEENHQETERLPVLVFVHGESYSFGTGNAFDGSVLALQAKAVVVTFNYRLGPLGFLRIPAPRGGTAASSSPYMTNYGLTDQLAALVWIHENIAGFGGDPRQVTVMGHGTGSALVHFVMISPQLHPSVPLFQRSILLGGSAYAPWSLIENMEASSMKLARMLNCTARQWAGAEATASFPPAFSSSPSGSYQQHHEVLRDHHPYEDGPSASMLDYPHLGARSGAGASGLEYPPPPSLVLPYDHQRQQMYQQQTLTEAESDSIWRCLRNTPLKDFMQAAAEINKETPTFRYSFGPHVDHVSILSPPFESTAHRLADFDVLGGLATGEAVPLFADVDVTVGLEMPKRNRIFRTLIRNSFTYHLNEILATVANEYTDWKSPHQRPAIIREAAVQAVSDALFAAPMVKTADVHSQIVEKNRFYLFAFNFASRFSEYPQRLGTAHGEELPYVFGVPLVDYASYLFAGNISRDELVVSLAIMKVLGNFIHSGNPNHPVALDEIFQGKQERSKNRLLKWEPYDHEQQRYLLFDTRPKLKSHHRIHQLSLWLHLVPALNQPGVGVPNGHHLLDEHGNDESYDGLVRTLVFTKPTSSTTAATITGLLVPNYGLNSSNNQQGAVAASAPGGRSSASSSATATSGDGDDGRPADAHIYTTALAVTIGIGLSLLLINILIFAGVYYQTRRRSLTSSPPSGPTAMTPDQQLIQQQIPDVTASTATIGNGGAKPMQMMLKENGSIPTGNPQAAVSIGVETELQKTYMLHQASAIQQQNFGGTAVAMGTQRRSPASGGATAGTRCIVTGSAGGSGAALPYPPSEFADIPVSGYQQQPQQEMLLGQQGRPYGSGTLPRGMGRGKCVEFQTPDGGSGGMDFRDPRLTQTLDKRVKIGGVMHHNPPQQPATSKSAGGGGGPVCSCETDPLLLQSIHLVTHNVNAPGAHQHMLQQQQQGKSSIPSGYKDVRV